MTRSAYNSIELYDVNDGTNPITAFLTNENHSFPATPAGEVSVDDREAFSSTIVAFVGGTQATYQTALTDNNTVRITSALYEGTPNGWQNPGVSTDGVITIPGIATDAALSAVIIVTFDVRDNNGVLISGLTKSISLVVQREGAGGQVINMVSTSQSFTSDSEGTINDGQDAIVMTIETQGSVGTLIVATSIDGAGYVTQAMTSADVGGISAFSSSDSGDVDTEGEITTPVRLAFAPSNLGTASTVSVRVSGASGGFDNISVFKVPEGARGAASIDVELRIAGDTNIFRNAAGTAKTITATVKDQVDGNVITDNITYTWSRTGSGTVMPGLVRVVSTTDHTVVSGGGVEASGPEFDSIIVGPEDVDVQESFECDVVVSPPAEPQPQ